MRMNRRRAAKSARRAADSAPAVAILARGVDIQIAAVAHHFTTALSAAVTFHSAVIPRTGGGCNDASTSNIARGQALQLDLSARTSSCTSNPTGVIAHPPIACIPSPGRRMAASRLPGDITKLSIVAASPKFNAVSRAVVTPERPDAALTSTPRGGQSTSDLLPDMNSCQVVGPIPDESIGCHRTGSLIREEAPHGRQ